MFPGTPCQGDSDDEKDDFHGFFDDRLDTDVSENKK